jgi:hypothetical protein
MGGSRFVDDLKIEDMTIMWIKKLRISGMITW